ncbi:MAG TPA: hypothetical protein PKA24_13245, partial [Microthrixaceae bacterium]|nr:hypothetical protein [Microthrixaceae bacterium]HMT61822.1 hypothetical protein [Microthrixaceae bacterium]
MLSLPRSNATDHPCGSTYLACWSTTCSRVAPSHIKHMTDMVAARSDSETKMGRPTSETSNEEPTTATQLGAGRSGASGVGDVDLLSEDDAL